MAHEHGPARRPRRQFLRGSLAFLLGGPLAPAPALPAEARDPRWRVTRHGLAFGTRVSVTVAGMEPARADRAAAAALAEIAAVQSSVGLHAGNSALARLNRDGHLHAPDAHLHHLLAQARHWGAATDGAFDVTLQPLWQLYFAAAARGATPTGDAVAERLQRVDWRAIEIDPHRVAFARAGMQATLNGLAQGYASDRAWAVLKAHGVEHALVDAGEWRASGSSEPMRPWTLGVRLPLAGAGRTTALLDRVALRDAALASSGDDGYAFTADRRLHHILDPRTGRSPGELAAVTVLAPDACTADALSTACMVMGMERSLALVAALPGVEALLVRKDGRVVASRGWPGVDRGQGTGG